MLGTASSHRYGAFGDGRRHDVGTCFNAVWNHLVIAPAQFANALDGDDVGPGAGDARPALHEKVRQVDDLGFLRGILNDRRSLSQASGHHQVFCSGDSHFVEVNVSGAQPSILGRACDNVSCFEFYFRAKRFEPGEVQVDGSRSDRTATGQRNFCFPETREQWPKCEH